MGGEDVPYGVERYSNEVRRLYGVMDKRLTEAEWLGGDDYSIADMACWPWARSSRRQGVDKAELPSVKRWFDAIAQRPAVIRDMAKLEDKADQKNWSAEDWSNLFGSEQYRRR